MTSPGFSVDPDDLRGFSSRTRIRTVDFNGTPPDADGDWPSHQSTRRLHGSVQATGRGFSDRLNDQADSTDKGADEYTKQDSANRAAMKDLMGTGTSAFKDFAGAATGAFQTGVQSGVTAVNGVIQGATTGVNAAVQAATQATKAVAPGGAPGGTPVPLAAGATPDSPTSGHADNEKERDHGHAAANP